MGYSVWIFTRPLSHARTFPSLIKTSNERHYLCHWGMLVSEMSLLDAKAILTRTREYCAIDNTELGTMYDLFRDDDDRNNVHICREFSVVNLRQEWKWFSAQYVGHTDMTADELKNEGIYLSRQLETYVDG
jgi:hypothetical protein